MVSNVIANYGNVFHQIADHNVALTVFSNMAYSKKGFTEMLLEIFGSGADRVKSTTERIVKPSQRVLFPEIIAL